MEVFCYRVAKYVGSYVAALNGVDAIAFTAGIGRMGESCVRRFALTSVIWELSWMLRPTKKRRGHLDLHSGIKVKVAIIPTNEELAICRETVALI